MKKLNFVLPIGLFFLICTFSCNKDENQRKEPFFELQTAVIQKNEIIEIKNKIEILSSICKSSNILHTKKLNKIDSNIKLNFENELRKIFEPLIQNGKLIQLEIIQNLKTSKQWDLIINDEKILIEKMSDEDLIKLSLIYTNLNLKSLKVTEGSSTLRNCLSAALGIDDIAFLLAGNPKALTNSKTVIKLLKNIGLRYLGYIGLALTIADFIDCINDLA